MIACLQYLSNRPLNALNIAGFCVDAKSNRIASGNSDSHRLSPPDAGSLSHVQSQVPRTRRLPDSRQTPAVSRQRLRPYPPSQQLKKSSFTLGNLPGTSAVWAVTAFGSMRGSPPAADESLGWAAIRLRTYLGFLVRSVLKNSIVFSVSPSNDPNAPHFARFVRDTQPFADARFWCLELKRFSGIGLDQAMVAYEDQKVRASFERLLLTHLDKAIPCSNVLKGHASIQRNH